MKRLNGSGAIVPFAVNDGTAASPAAVGISCGLSRARGHACGQCGAIGLDVVITWTESQEFVIAATVGVSRAYQFPVLPGYATAGGIAVGALSDGCAISVGADVQVHFYVRERLIGGGNSVVACGARPAVAIGVHPGIARDGVTGVDRHHRGVAIITHAAPAAEFGVGHTGGVGCAWCGNRCQCLEVYRDRADTTCIQRSEVVPIERAGAGVVAGLRRIR